MLASGSKGAARRREAVANGEAGSEALLERNLSLIGVPMLNRAPLTLPISD